MKATLQKIEPVGPTITTFWFRPEDELRYTAGQFIELTIPHPNADDRGIQRWFTLSSSPTEELVAITTRYLQSPSTFKQALKKLVMSDCVQISQAMGDFVLPMQKSVPILFVAAGIGITPVRSILKSTIDEKFSRDIRILYTATSVSDHLFAPLITSTTKAQEFITHELLDTDEILLEILNAYEKEKRLRIYISGPETFTEKLFAQLGNSIVPPQQIITDYFHGYIS